MTPKERVHAVLVGGSEEGSAPDRVPIHHSSVSSRVASRILGREAYVGGGINRWREAAALWNGPDAHAEFVERTRRDSVDIAIALGHDLVRPGYWRDRRRPAARLDDHTFRYESEDGSRWEVKRLEPATELYNTIDRSPEPELALDDLDELVERAERSSEGHAPTEDDFADVRYALDRVGEEREVRAAGLWTSIPVDSPAWLEATLLRPDLVARLLDTQVVRSVKNAEVLAKMGARVLFGGGDFASDHGPMYSPQVFHELMLPRLKRISECCRRLGLYHFFGTDGNVWPVAEDLYGSSGICGHYEFDRRAGMDIPKLHSLYPHITMVGNISSFTLHTGSPEEVEAETRACLEEAKETGKVIAGCSNIIISETPDRNVDVMLETIAKYR